MKKEIRTILKNRAIAMAQEPEQKRVSASNIEVIVFILAGETYSIESAFVVEVFQLRDFTPLPGVPSYIFGVINLHGKILPVIDLRKLLALPEKGLSENKKVVILCNEQMEFGIVADVVEGIQTFALEDILETPPTLTESGKKYLKGVTKEHIVVLEAESILNDIKIIVNEEVI